MSLGSKLLSGTAIAKAMLAVERPDRLPRALVAMAPWGTSTAALVAGAAARYPDRLAVIDDDGPTTYRELWRRSQAIAAGLAARGVTRGVTVGLLARNRRGFVEALTAVAATGADLVLLNTGFAGPQLADVVSSEGIEVLVHDDEFTSIVDDCGARLILGEGDMDELALAGTIRPPAEPGTVVILTSGTTGRPKGATRTSDAGAIEGVGAVLDRIPLRLGDTQVIAAPLFHAWGLSHLMLGLARCTTNVVARRFDPERTLAVVDRQRADVLVVVPVMMARIVGLDHERARCPSDPEPPRDRVEWLGDREWCGDQGPRAVRARPLQPVRLDRSRSRARSRHRPTSPMTRAQRAGPPSG